MSVRRPFLTARWVHLAMLNYEIDPHVLAPRVPAGTELDEFDGKTFVSIVGFQFLDTRVLGLGIPFHRNFEEVNLRFYVRRDAPDGLRRGVVFIKEIVPRRAIAWIARWVYNENYVALPMTHLDEIGESAEPRLTYGWISGSRVQRLAVRPSGAAYLPDGHSEESFITEHYWGYVRRRNGQTLEYRVEHPRWPVWRCGDADFECDVAGTYGSDLVPYLTAAPASAFVAEGSPVVVHRGHRLDGRR